MKRSLHFCMFLSFIIILFFALPTTAEERIINTAVGGWVGDGLPALQSSLLGPRDIWRDPSGDIYIADYLQKIVRKIDAATNIVTTVAGNGKSGSFPIVPGMKAVDVPMCEPMSLCTYNGYLYIGDYFGACGSKKIYKVDLTTNEIQTLAGGGWDNPYPGNGQTYHPLQVNLPGEISDIFPDNSGNLYFVSQGTLFKINPQQDTLSLLSGRGDGSDPDPQSGKPANECFLFATGGCIDSQGNIFLFDNYHLIFWMIDSNGILVQFAGDGTSGDRDNCFPELAQFRDQIYGISCDSQDNIWIADSGNNWIRKIDRGANIISRMAGDQYHASGFEGDGQNALNCKLGIEPWDSSQRQLEMSWLVIHGTTE